MAKEDDAGRITSAISGEVVKVSGEVIYVTTRSGDYVVVSGEVSLPSTQAVKISGETVIAKTSGDVAKISGEIVDIKTPSFVFSPIKQVIGAISGGIALSSGDVVSVTVKCDSKNSGDIYLGGDTTGMTPYSGKGFLMEASEAISIDISNPNKIHAFSTVSGYCSLWILGVK